MSCARGMAVRSVFADVMPSSTDGKLSLLYLSPQYRRWCFASKAQSIQFQSITRSVYRANANLGNNRELLTQLLDNCSYRIDTAF